MNALSPDKLEDHAKDILLDESDYEDIQATSLTALRQFADLEELDKDKELVKSVRRMTATAKSPKYKKSAKEFLAEYEQRQKEKK